MKISGPKLYGIFGFPLGHTLSPALQEAAFRALGLKAFYLSFEVRREEFLRLMRRRKNLVLDGFNVTVPYKEEVLRFLDGVSPEARAIGAVNTVLRKGGRWMGFNTDSRGFTASLEKDAKFRAAGKKILILGAGGSARAAAYALAQKGAKIISIANRTPARAKKIVTQYRRLFPEVEWRNSNLAEADLVVNATSVGLRKGDRSLVRPRDFLNRRALFVDLIYKPAETRFLREARLAGHPTLNGLGMLLYQGAEAFRLWTGFKAPLEVMQKTLIESLRHAH